MKEKVDLIVKGGLIVTLGSGGCFEGGVAVRGSRIVGVDKTPALEDKYYADEVIDARGHIVMPGLIDVHVHTAQQFLRGKISELTKRPGFKLRYPIWKNYLIPFESCLREEDVYLSGLATYCNMIKMGTTCFAEHGGPHPDAMGKAAAEVGIRGTIARSTLDINHDDLPKNMRDTTKSAISESERLIRNWHNRAEGRIRVSLSLRQIIVCSLELYKTFAQLAEKYDLIIQTHIAEGAYEIYYCLQNFGKRTAEVLNEIGFLSKRVLAAHSAQLSENELRIFSEKNVKVAHCPSGNFASFGAPKIPHMMRNNIVVGLGSDGGAWNNLDLFREMKISKTCQLSHFGALYLDNAVVRDEDLVRMATVEGAKAMGLEGEIGRLEVGMKADMIIVKVNELWSAPCNDPYFNLVNCVSGNDVRTVIIDGKVVMKDRRLKTVDEEHLMDEIGKRVPQIMDRFEGLITQR